MRFCCFISALYKWTASGPWSVTQNSISCGPRVAGKNCNQQFTVVDQVPSLTEIDLAPANVVLQVICTVVAPPPCPCFQILFF